MKEGRAPGRLHNSGPVVPPALLGVWPDGVSVSVFAAEDRGSRVTVELAREQPLLLEKNLHHLPKSTKPAGAALARQSVAPGDVQRPFLQLVVHARVAYFFVVTRARVT